MGLALALQTLPSAAQRGRWSEARTEGLPYHAELPAAQGMGPSGAHPTHSGRRLQITTITIIPKGHQTEPWG